MPEFITLFSCPNREFAGLTFPPTFPLELSGPYTLLTAPGLALPDSTAPGHPLGFSASHESMVHRNWKPCSWDVTGTASTGFIVQGVATTPGPVTGSTNYITDPTEIVFLAEWDGLSFHPAKPQPDFSDALNVRTMIMWSGGSDGFYPDIKTIYSSNAFPILLDENGANATGCYIGVSFQIYGSIEPYYWRRTSFYCEHDFRVIITFGYYFSPGIPVPDTWFLDEGQNVNWQGGSSFSRNVELGRVFNGSFNIQDTTGRDPSPAWGDVSMFGFDGTVSYPINLTARVRRNFLKIPGYD